MTNKHYFTSESVTEGHPDKICDQISDAILDAIYEKDPYGRVAVETTVSTGLVLIAGQISTSCYIDIPKIVRKKICDIGYNRAKFGFDGETCGIITSVDEQSPDIAQGVYKSGIGVSEENIGAGDQGMMFGYACNETKELMPLPISIAHQLTRKLTEVRKSGLLKYLRPDGKSQVTVEYQGSKPIRVDKVVLSSQHDPDISTKELASDLKSEVILPILGEWIDGNTEYYINPTGRFVIGGPQSDTGLTGRKIIVDTYGGYSRHGGGAFSGKDPTKVDRSASYAARYVAKNIVSAGLADRCEVQIAYAIGVSNPVSILVDTFGTNVIEESRIVEGIKKIFDLRPGKIIESLELRQPIYSSVAAYGHFGRNDLDLPWERVNKMKELRSLL